MTTENGKLEHMRAQRAKTMGFVNAEMQAAERAAAIRNEQEEQEAEIQALRDECAAVGVQDIKFWVAANPINNDDERVEIAIFEWNEERESAVLNQDELKKFVAGLQKLIKE